MINLTFGEQVKIVLSRKGMTIKELAEEIEAKTGKKMSRQNLTQRLGRDNFQEQDMRMIADILGCSFQLSILASVEAEKASVIEEVPPTGRELEKLLVKEEMKAARAQAKREAERDLTVGEFVDMMKVPVESVGAIEEAEEPEETVIPAETEVAESEELVAEEEAVEAAEVPEEVQVEPAEVVEEPQMEAVEEEVQPVATQTAEPEEKRGSKLDRIARIINVPKKREAKDFQPIKQREDVEEDKVQGDVNPYTGHEYQSNSVRMHPKRIGYVQVYDRKEHKWTDMTEWAFLGFEERKKATLGKDYEPPIYLD